MRTLYYLATVACLAVSAMPASAEEKIEGAFGKKFGEIFDVSSASSKITLGDGSTAYEFTPANPIRLFSKYFVLITPTTRNVYSIFTGVKLANVEHCRKEQAVIMELLTKKYGKETKVDSINLYEKRVIIKGAQMIITQLNGLTEILEMQYCDMRLQEIAEKERVAIEAGKSNASGL